MSKIGRSPTLVFKSRISRTMVRNNPDWVFIFGDNVSRTGFGGQAAQMRGEPNTIGIATKWRPSLSLNAFFSDTEFDKCLKIVTEDFEKVFKAAAQGKTIVIPSNGIGTGLSDLQNKAPKLLLEIDKMFSKLKKMTTTIIYDD